MKYKAWDTGAKRWRDEFDWVINPETGKAHWIHDNEFYQGEATQLVLCRATGVLDIDGREIYEGDFVIPTKFNDIANEVRYVGNGFYRSKKHGEKTYLNPLGSCEVRIIGNIFQHKII